MRICLTSLLLLSVLLLPLHLDAQDQTKSIEARSISEALNLDGRLDESFWSDVPILTGFLQKTPDEGAPPANRTEVQFAYDGEYLYVGATNYIENRDDVSTIVTRRDRSGASDRIIISLDTYRDKRTAYSFSISAGGARTDYYHATDSEHNRDYSFDPVWTARTEVYDDRWTAEMRIPFSQLRFNDVDEQVWGLNINRYMPLRREDLYWIVVPQNESGWSSRMGELTGIRGIEPSARLELLPYASGSARMASDVDPDDPYQDDIDLRGRVGLDAKIGLGPNLTIDAAINPDFGQVEADPAEVNLSAFETTFSERRPFFVEGVGLFNYNGAHHYYSRRIGGRPHGAVSADASFIDQPDNSTILGAAKLTGRLPSGLSIGVISAVTEREYAKYIDATSQLEEEEEVEPLAYYGAARVKQEFNDGASTVGVIGTVVLRDLDTLTTVGRRIPSQAYTAGLDWEVNFADRAYKIDGNFAGSRVIGDPLSIERLQRRSTRYFQRPDADYVELDPSRTSLTGYAASLELEKVEGDWTWEVAGAVESPEYELNDLGRLSGADDIDIWGDMTFRETDPGSFYQEWDVRLEGSSNWNFGGVRQSTSASLNFNFNWPDYLFYNYAGIGFNDKGLSDAKTRGGPLMDNENTLLNAWIGMYNNFGASLRWNWHFGYGAYEYNGFFINTNFGISADIGSRLELKLDPGFYTEITPRQYVARRDGGGSETFGSRYIFSELDFSQTSVQIRANYAVTPDLTVELYLEPFVATGSYSKFGELAAAGTGEVDLYGTQITLDSAGRVYSVNDNGDSFTLANPDFTIRSFRSNMVVRWEWLPGSTLFFIWQQNRGGFEPTGSTISPGDWFDALSDDGDNILALKVSWWIDA